MLPQLTYRMMTTVDKRMLAKTAYNFAWKGMRSVQRHKKRLKQGVVFPPFLYLSIVNSCNLRCQGCWVDVAAARRQIDLDQLNRTINEAKAHGNSFFGILGGEPFMHPELMDLLAEHPDCYFQLFTNGQFITDEVAEQLRRLGNGTPLISIEGDQMVSDERRGREGVLDKTLKGLDAAIRHKVLTGVATSVCQTNIDDLVREEWIDHLIERGVHYVWFHTYRPVGPDAKAEELSLSREQLLKVRKFIVRMRAKKPIGIVDAYWDDKGQALCPMATGISHHVGPGGDIEPCPIIQFAKEKISDERGIYDTITQSEYLKDFRDVARENTRGCVVLERPDLMKQVIEKHAAPDTTARQTAMEELERMASRNSQHQPGEEVPEEHWLYRFAKRHWFFGFGAYS